MDLKFLLCTLTLAASTRALAGPMPVYSNTQFTGKIFTKKSEIDRKRPKISKKPQTQTKTSAELKPANKQDNASGSTEKPASTSK
jgi:hypothetical protein